MSWDKIDNHLFEKYCVEGEDKELCNLMEEHDKEIRAKAIDEFIKKIREKEEELYEADGGGIYNFSEERAYNNGIIEMSDTIDKIAEEMKKEK